MSLIVSAQSDGVLFQEKIVSFQVQVNQAVLAIDVEGLAPLPGALWRKKLQVLEAVMQFRSVLAYTYHF